mgnify:CR=1 FL=1
MVSLYRESYVAFDSLKYVEYKYSVVAPSRAKITSAILLVYECGNGNSICIYGVNLNHSHATMDCNRVAHLNIFLSEHLCAITERISNMSHSMVPNSIPLYMYCHAKVCGNTINIIISHIPPIRKNIHQR